MQAPAFPLSVANLPAQKYAYTNRIYLKREKFIELANSDPDTKVSSSDPVILVTFSAPDLMGSQKQWVFQASHSRDTDGLNITDVGFNALQRKCANVSLQQPINVSVFTPGSDEVIVSMTVSVDLLKKVAGGPGISLDAAEMAEAFKKAFDNQVMTVGQQLAFDYNGQKFDLIVEGVDYPALEAARKTRFERGQVKATLNVEFVKRRDSQTPILFTSGKASANTNTNLFKKEFNFEQVGIGGLGSEFEKIFRRAFASRIFPGLIKEIGMNHVRGILLYGPPGCGKTLIARQIGKILNAHEPKIVNGPEILDKYVGGSEEKIRDLFKDAEKEMKEMGDASQLHVIIFDEMDAIMKTRGSTRDSTGVADSIVNQLLSKIDGVDSLNNILIIGMTNRKDMIDEAVLRPGRLELHVEIGLPDTAGRLQIINIHTSKMRKNNRMTEAAINHLPDLAEQTKNFTGAEIEGLVRNAASFAFARNINVQDLSNADSANVKVDWHDFQTALTETTPAFGNKDQVELLSLYRNGIVSYGDSFEGLHNSLLKLVNQSRCSTRTPLLTVLLEGPAGTGKTALAAKICQDSGFPLIRFLSADSMIGFSEAQKCGVIQKAFVDAYKSSLSIIFIDDIERILEYTPLGPRFSNIVLQTLIVYLKKVPPSADRRLMVVGTTSIAHLLDDLQLTQTFNVSLHVSMLQQPAEIVSVLKNFCSLSVDELNRIAAAITRPIGIKKLLMVLEMVQSSGDDLNPDTFLSCLETCGY